MSGFGIYSSQRETRISNSVAVGIFCSRSLKNRNMKIALKAYRSTSFWLWMFPLTYLIHIAEEYWGGEGYSAYLLRLRGITLSPTRFIAAQGLGWALMVVGIIFARQFKFPKLLLVIMGATVLGNSLTHLGTSLMRPGYGPGLLTAMLIWMPLGLATLIRFRGSMKGSRYWLGIAIGFGVNGIIGLLTMRGVRIL